MIASHYLMETPPIVLSLFLLWKNCHGNTATRACGLDFHIYLHATTQRFRKERRVTWTAAGWITGLSTSLCTPQNRSQQGGQGVEGVRPAGDISWKRQSGRDTECCWSVILAPLRLQPLCDYVTLLPSDSSTSEPPAEEEFITGQRGTAVPQPHCSLPSRLMSVSSCWCLFVPFVWIWSPCSQQRTCLTGWLHLPGVCYDISGEPLLWRCQTSEPGHLQANTHTHRKSARAKCGYSWPGTNVIVAHDAALNLDSVALLLLNSSLCPSDFSGQTQMLFDKINIKLKIALLLECVDTK